MIDRKAQIVGSIDLASAKGLELGPLINPVVPRGSGDIRYLDHVDTDALRERYSTHIGFDLDAIVPIDYASGEGSVRDAVGADAPFDYVIASHVIEHVPDLVRWLDDLRSVLRDDGVLSLAIPDHRCCFDALRSPSVVADIVHAHLTGATTPTPRQVFDHYFSAVSWHGLIAWGEQPPFSEVVSVHAEQEAIERTREIAATGEYQDVHCWVFTPRSFRHVFAGLQRLGLVSFVLESSTDTSGGEFFARLRATDRHTATASANPADADRGSEHAAVRADLAAAGRRLDVVQAELDATIASRSWRITEPLRAFNAWRAARQS